MTNVDDPRRYVDALSRSGLTIYDAITPGDPELWIPTEQLQALLNEALSGESLRGLPLRTRSKRLKELVCKALGYPVPGAFRKTQPRFPGQCFDTYVQKSNNLQVWNEEVAPTRRYVLIRLSSEDEITEVKVVSGNILAKLDKTGTLTHKYQARISLEQTGANLVTAQDSPQLSPLLASGKGPHALTGNPVNPPERGQLLPIAEVFDRLSPIIGSTFHDTGSDQERNRGGELHKLVCEALGYTSFQEDGRFPDVKHQLLEVKLQTSPTIDLGLVSPDSTSPLDLPHPDGIIIRHCDVRYAVFPARVQDGNVQVTGLYLVTGERFYACFPQFQGRIVNAKLQIPLPRGFFSPDLV